MKVIFILFLLSFLATGSSHLGGSGKISYQTLQKAGKYKKQYALSCSPNLSILNFNGTADGIPLLDGWGNYSMPVTAGNDSSKIYFEQGINMYYGFHIIEAIASFDKSINFDSSFAMGYWGKALAYGPNINDFGYSSSPDALSAMRKAKDLSGTCTAEEKGLIDAMQTRYSTDTLQSRQQLNELYAEAMRKLYANFHRSTDVAALCADALMVLHPWDLYYKNYDPKPWTPEIVSILEGVLRNCPDHPGASHYYIHAVEASAHPQKALAVAKKLPALMPGVSHIVHMPSHIFIRSGYYKQGEEVNEKAVKDYYNYLSKFPSVINNAPLYLIHNLHMQATCANMDGRYPEAIKLSIVCRNSFESSWQNLGGFMGMYFQYVYMTPYLTMIRFGKWDDILRTKKSPESYAYAKLLWFYGQGLAYARKHDFSNARNQLDSLRQVLKNDQLKSAAPPNSNPAIAGAEVAERILDGVISEEQNRLTAAIAILKRAVILEDSMIYDEPKDWVHPVRQYLGNVLFKKKKYTEAERVYKEDLKINPNNGWSLTGLAIVLAKQGRREDAREMQLRAAKAFSKSSVQILHPVF